MNRLKTYITQEVHIAPLVVFRMVFGLILLFSVIRFAYRGWIHDLYVEPKFHFKYSGFSWVKPFDETGMYLIFIIMAMSFLLVAIGLFYRFASITGFLLFTYVELLDKANYLNHYYFVSLICFLMIFVPANRYFSVDAYLKPHIQRTKVPIWTIGALKLQLGLVYFFAGVAKLNYEWLFNANPLKIWLPAHSNIPFIGKMLAKPWVAYVASWFGAIYDLSIPILLLIKKYRGIAYFLVIAFHVSTAVLFQIGVFPYVMIGATLIFFSEDFHKNVLEKLNIIFKLNISLDTGSMGVKRTNPFFIYTLVAFFSVQTLLPFRYLLYPGNLFWTEQGYRFSWRVMLMEKAGYATFRIVDKEFGRSWEAKNYEYLTPNQEKMMSTQPDMILEFAHFLSAKAKEQGVKDPEIYVDAFVSLNGQFSRRFIDPEVNLAQVEPSLEHKTWILPYE